ncbi:DUF3040 domain-containing protein [Streptomyces sp. NPDC029674]|uniref:DUF3040 domain-containing protein n=1 Tax=Streptomyces sp. NPDC029674 TaxID=3365297 RepID=UPI00384E5871
MSTDRLPEHEQRVLDEMEAALRNDRRLKTRMWALRARRRVHAVLTHTPRPLTVAFFATVSCTLLVIGIRTSAPGVIWAFACMWPLTLIGFLRLLCRWTEP